MIIKFNFVPLQHNKIVKFKRKLCFYKNSNKLVIKNVNLN